MVARTPMISALHVGALTAALVCAVALCGAAGDASQDAPPPVSFSEQEIALILQHSPLPAVPADPTNRFADDPVAVEFGHRLFFETALSGRGDVSCATCHDPLKAFADGKQLSEGVGVGKRHSPALWNVAYNRWFFWDGRSDSLWSQALVPLDSEVEMDGGRMHVARVMHADERRRRQYEAIFGPMPPMTDTARFPVEARFLPAKADSAAHQAWMRMSEEDREAVSTVYANVGKAIAAYERRLVSRESPFDAFVRELRAGEATEGVGEGGGQAISESAKRGLKLFVGRANCRLCHSGPNFTDGEFHNTGVPPLERGLPRDTGRYGGVDLLRSDPFNAAGDLCDDPRGSAAARTRSLTNSTDNWGRFKTPTLRNVALTPPYMHQGQFAGLDEVLKFYSTLDDAVQLDHHREQVLQPLNLTEQEISDLQAFLESLTGSQAGGAEWADVPAELLQPPASATKP